MSSFNREIKLAVGKQAFIINIARGAFINEKEMVEYLVQGEIRGAGLEVFKNKSNVPKEFFELDNVVLSCHHIELFLHQKVSWLPVNW